MADDSTVFTPSTPDYTRGVVRYEIRTIAPDEAASMLATNPGNRNVRQQTVRRYAKQMSAGLWRLNHQGIAIGPDGLIDGQHRLHAVIQSGNPQPFFVCFYGSEAAARDGQLTSDIGAKRTAAEILAIDGVLPASQSRTVVATMTALVLIADGLSSGATDLSPQEFEAMLDRERDAIEWSMKTIPDDRKINAVVRAAFAFAWKAYPVEVEEFAGMIVRHEAPPESAAQTWMRLATQQKFRTSGGAVGRREVGLRALSVIRAHVMGLGAIRNVQAGEAARDWFAAKIRKTAKAPRK